MNYWSFLLLPLMFVIYPAFADSHTEIIDTFSYSLTVDEHTFTIPYEVDATVLAMAIDPELNSLLIGIDNTLDSIFTITLQHEIINAENNEFAILVNGLEVDYEITSNAESSTLTFFVPTFTEEVEIIGTHVIPEFPFGLVFIFGIMITISIIFTKTKLLQLGSNSI